MTARTLIIAEAGVNMCQSLDFGYALIDASVAVGADVYKTQLEVNSQYTLGASDIKKLSKRCDQRGIKFACTAFDKESMEFILSNCNMPFVKIPSGKIDPDIILLAGRSGLPIIVSTGGMNMNEITHRIALIRFNQLTLLHCVSAYPTPLESVNLRAMVTLREQSKRHVGISDHSANLMVPIAAVALGAEVVEVHITMDRQANGPDHKSSLEPYQFKQMVQGIRDVEIALGSPVKQRQACEVVA